MVVAASGGRARNLTQPGVADWSWPGAGRALDRVLLDARRRAGHLGDAADGSRTAPDAGRFPERVSDVFGNGRTIVFQSTRDGEFELYAMASDGRRQRNLTRHPSEDKWAVVT